MALRKTTDKIRRPGAKRWVFIIVGFIVIFALVALLIARHHKPADSYNTASKGETQSKPQAQNDKGNKPVGNPDPNVPGGSTGTSSDKTGTPATPSTVTLTTPTGTFVSNHRPNLSGSPAPNTENSTCNTVAGAKCEIHFTKDGVTKALAAKDAAADGTVSWDWNVKDLGLTAGTWKVEAIATQGSQIQTAQDPTSLEIAQ